MSHSPLGNDSERPRKRPSPFRAFALLAALISLFAALPAHAWKPVSHVYLADRTFDDAKDGKVTIYATDYKTGKVKRDANGNPVAVGEYNVDPRMLGPILAHRANFRAGVFGPDAYPDIATGQQVIHPAGEATYDDPQSQDVNSGGPGSNPWLQHIWDLAYGDKGEPQDRTDPNRAFAAGYLFHAAGDMYMHTFVNEYTGGPFHLKENALKHVLLEGYVGKRIPAMQDFDVSIDGGVSDFIYRNLTYGKPGSDLETKLLKGKNTRLSVPAIFSKMRNELQEEIDGYYAKKAEFDKRYDGRIALAKQKAAEADACGLFDFSCSKVVLYAKSATHYAQAAAIQVEKAGYMTIHGPITTYKEHWREDIDDGLKLWPGLSHELAKALFFNPSGHMDSERAKALAKDYFVNHLLSMIGLPDAVGGTIQVIEDVKEALGIPAIEEILEKLKIIDLDEFLLETAFGMTKEEAKQYFDNPENVFDETMNNPKFDSDGGTMISLQSMNQDVLHLQDPGYQNPNETIDLLDFAPSFNTLQMTKLLLLPVSEVNRLMADLGSTQRLEENAGANAMLGFIRSLDASNQWHINPEKMIAARDGDAYRKIFAQEPGEIPVGYTPLEIWPSYYQLKPGEKVALTVHPEVPVQWSVVNPVEGDKMGDGAPNVYAAPKRVAENTTVTIRATATDGSDRVANMQVLLIASPPRPKVFVWTGGGNTDNWTDPYNWGNADYYPGEPDFEGKDDVVLSRPTGGGSEVNLDKAVLIKTLEMGQGTTLKGLTLTVKDGFEWTGGAVENTLELPHGCNVKISGENDKTVSGKVINGGIAVWSGSGDLDVTGQGSFLNTGTFDAKDDGTIGGYSCCIAPSSFVNSGTFVKSGGAGEVKFGLINYINNGTTEVKQGTVRLESGLHVFGDNSTFTGPGNIVLHGGELHLQGKVNASSLSLLEVEEGSEVYGENAAVQGTPTIHWTGGEIYGSLSLPESGILNIDGDARKSFSAPNFVNAGTINWGGTGGTLIYGDTSITNTKTGVIEFLTDMEIGGVSCCVDPSVFNNAGVINKADGAGTTQIGALSFNNTGTLNAKTGTIKIGSGPHTWGTGAVLSGAGKTQVQGDLTLTGEVVVSAGHTLEVVEGGDLFGGTLANKAYTGTGTLKGGGTFAWNGGSLNGNLVLAQDMTTTIGKSLNWKGIQDANLTNNGTVIWNETGTILVGGPSLITNNGTFDMRADTDFGAKSCCAFEMDKFVNNGVFTKTAGAGTSSVGGIDFTNTGNVEVKAGKLQFKGGSKYLQTAGMTNLNGGSLAINGNPLIIQGGILAGTGKVTGKVINAAVVGPGHSPGRIEIEGDYEQTPTGALNVEIAGPTAAEYDQLAVTGNVTLDGTLNLAMLGDYRPDAGKSFDILQYGAKSGGFAKTTGTYIGDGKGFDAEVTETGLKLRTVGGAIPPIAGDLDGNGDVEVTDAVKALRIVVGLDVATPAQLELGDIAPAPGTGPRAGQPYGDGEITIQDAVRILRIVVGAEPTL